MFLALACLFFSFFFFYRQSGIANISLKHPPSPSLIPTPLAWTRYKNMYIYIYIKKNPQ